MKEFKNKSTFEKTKLVLDEMISDKKKKVSTANTTELNQIFKELSERRQSLKKLES